MATSNAYQTTSELLKGHIKQLLQSSTVILAKQKINCRKQFLPRLIQTLKDHDEIKSEHNFSRKSFIGGQWHMFQTFSGGMASVIELKTDMIDSKNKILDAIHQKMKSRQA